tara:strand:+ start:12710 stop:13552 length:843 start_codon:yes stop_codon:yes gene_type:complete
MAKHSKYKNTGIIFELLVRQLTEDTINQRSSKCQSLIKKYFNKSTLLSEYKLYKRIVEKKENTEARANLVIESTIKYSEKINLEENRKLKYNLIKEISSHYDVKEFFNHNIPNYKPYAALYCLMEDNRLSNEDYEITLKNKITLVEHITQKTETKKVNNQLADFLAEDKDTRKLVYQVLLQEFNSKYDGLLDTQKQALSEILNNIDNKERLKSFYNLKINEIKSDLLESIPNIKDKVVKIKINTLANLLKEAKVYKEVNDESIARLLKYYELLEDIHNEI